MGNEIPGHAPVPKRIAAQDHQPRGAPRREKGPDARLAVLPATETSARRSSFAWPRIDSRDGQEEFLDGNEQSRQLAKLALANMKDQE